jgi:hypothetical protein
MVGMATDVADVAGAGMVGDEATIGVCLENERRLGGPMVALLVESLPAVHKLMQT